MPDRYDLIVLGGGPGGYNAALHAASFSKRVLLIEENALGGVCLNRGCIPTKALLRSSALYHTMAMDGPELGVSSAPAHALPRMLAHAQRVEDRLRDGIASLLQRANVTLITGHGQVLDPHTVCVQDQRYTGDYLLLAVGSSPALPPIEGLSLKGVVTSDHLLTGQGEDPERLIIIGGGVIGMEFAQIYSNLGRSVVVLEALPRLLANMDREFGQRLQMALKDRGCEIHTGATVRHIRQEGDALCCTFCLREEEFSVEGDRVLVCTGRKPNTSNLFSPDWESALALDRGYVPVSATFETKIPHIYAIGDIVLGGAQLAHAAEAQAKNAVAAMFGKPQVKNLSLIPSCVFTSPEIASVGLSADEAKAQGIPVLTRKGLASANGKALVEGAERGFAKLVYHKETEALLGAQLMCPHAGEMIGLLAACIHAGLTLKQLDSTVFPHPTVSEMLIPS